MKLINGCPDFNIFILNLENGSIAQLLRDNLVARSYFLPLMTANICERCQKRKFQKQGTEQHKS